MEIHQKISVPKYQKLKTMVKRRRDQQNSTFDEFAQKKFIEDQKIFLWNYLEDFKNYRMK